MTPKWKRWTPAEVARLKKLLESELTFEKIASRLGRKRHSVYMKARKLGLTKRTKRICLRCNARPRKKHFNAKWCSRCAAELVKRPAGKLTPAQERKVRRLAGKMFIKKLAKEVGTSDSNLDRWAKQNGVNINALKYQEKVVAEVCEYYAKHGKRKTEKRFPNVRVRSIVERYTHEPRQVRWTAAQLVALAQMGGLVSFEKQAAYFNRPNANAGSIKSAWVKKFGHGSININGLSKWIAVHYVKPTCPFYQTSFWDHERGQRLIALWVDVERHLREDVPEHLDSAVRALAKFQRWLHGRGDAKASILSILERFA